MILMIFFKTICSYLERWLYRGECCDPHGEFLIEKATEKLERRDRLYWIEGFALTHISGVADEDNALFGLLDDVYLCGKTVHLLQLCRAQVKMNLMSIIKPDSFIR